MAIVVTALGKDGVTGGSPNTSPNNSNSVNITTPGAGDSIIAVAVTDSGTVTFTWPSGFTQVLSQFSSADGQQHGVAIKDSASGSETATGTITNSGGTGMIHAVVGVSGLDATTKQDVTAQVTNTNSNSASTLTLTRSITPVTNGALILAFMACDTSGNDATTTFSTSAGSTGAWTKLFDINSGFYNIAVGYAIQSTAGALTVQAQSTYTGNSDGSLIVMAMRPAAGGGTQSYSYSATGGMTLAGTGPALRVRTKAGAGGLTVAGTSPALRVQTKATAGGLTFAGAATRNKGFQATSSGGLQLSGAATMLRAATRAGAGGLSFAGSSSMLRAAARAAAGGLTLAGTAATSFVQAVRTVVASGGLTFGGGALVSYVSQLADALTRDWPIRHRHHRPRR